MGAIAWAGTRLFDRRVGFVAAALLAVAFLPGPLRPLRAQRRGARAAGLPRARRRRRHPARRAGRASTSLAGVAVGVAAAFKYTAGIVARRGRSPPRCSRPARPAARVRGLAVTGLAAALVGFLALNPYALLSFDAFRAGLRRAVGGVDGRRRQARPRPDPSAALLRPDAALGARARCRWSRRVAAALPLWARRYRVAMVLLPAPLAVLRLHGCAGPLLRPLGAARLPVPDPARRVGGGGRARARPPACPALVPSRRVAACGARCPGARALAAQRRRDDARRHPRDRARVDAREHPGGREDRARADRAGRLGGAVGEARRRRTSACEPDGRKVLVRAARSSRTTSAPCAPT